MRRLLSLLLTLSIMAAAFAQLPKTSNSTALTKVIKVKEYQGWYFSASLDIKAVPSDSSGMAGAAMLQVGKKDWDFIKNTGSSTTVKKEAGSDALVSGGKLRSLQQGSFVFPVKKPLTDLIA